MNEIVKYHNNLNTVVMRRWTGEEMNLFMAIITQIKEQGAQTLFIEAEQLYNIVQYSGKSKKRWEDTIKGAILKISQLVYWEENEKEFVVIPIFSKFKFNKEKGNIEIKVSDEYEHIFNQLDKYFTSFDVADFLILRSTYSKTMFRLLKQWKTIGKKEFKKEELFTLLDVPKSVQTNNNFNKRVLEPIKKELSPIFEHLTITPIKSKTRGNPVVSYKFTWVPEVPQKKITPHFKKVIRQEPVPDWLIRENETQGKDSLSSSELDKIDLEKIEQMKKLQQEILGRI